MLFLHTSTSYADAPASQGLTLLLQLGNQEEKILNLIPTNKDKLMKEYANFETYRPDSFSDASRNPFGPKRYKEEDLIN